MNCNLKIFENRGNFYGKRLWTNSDSSSNRTVSCSAGAEHQKQLSWLDSWLKCGCDRFAAPLHWPNTQPAIAQAAQTADPSKWKKPVDVGLTWSTQFYVIGSPSCELYLHPGAARARPRRVRGGIRSGGSSSPTFNSAATDAPAKRSLRDENDATSTGSPAARAAVGAIRTILSRLNATSQSTQKRAQLMSHILDKLTTRLTKRPS